MKTELTSNVHTTQLEWRRCSSAKFFTSDLTVLLEYWLFPLQLNDILYLSPNAWLNSTFTGHSTLSSTSMSNISFANIFTQPTFWSGHFLTFMSMATISMAPTPLLSTALMKSWKSLNWVPGPQMPRRDMYAMLRGSEAPVALQYTTQALGNFFCNSRTVKPVLLGLVAPLG